MNLKIIYLLEDIKSGNKNICDIYDSDNLLDNETKEHITKWYLKYANNDQHDLSKIVELMYFLYIKQDIDLLSPQDYSELRDLKSKQYDIKNGEFLNMLTAYRKILFE